MHVSCRLLSKITSCGNHKLILQHSQSGFSFESSYHAMLDIIRLMLISEFQHNCEITNNLLSLTNYLERILEHLIPQNSISLP